MRDPIRASNENPIAGKDCGIAFDIADLLLIRSWCDFHDMPFVICLDQQQSEEIIAFQPGAGAASRLRMWRQTDAILVQPITGPAQRHTTVTDALHRLGKPARLVLTDIRANRWPAD
jgi:hypothetical protein